MTRYLAKGWGVLFTVVILDCAARLCAAAPLRIALPPVPSVQGADPEAASSICLGLYLRERLDECRSVRRVSDARAGAIFSELRGGKREFDPARFLADFSEFVPVDAILIYWSGEGVFEVEAHLKDGTRKHSSPSRDGTTVRAIVHGAAAWIGETLGLPAEEQAILTADRITDPQSFQAYCVAQRIYARWPNNSGEYRLKVLRPAFDKDAECVPLAAEILRSADYLLASSNRVQDFAKKGIGTAKVVLPTVLGTELEDAAHGIVLKQPETFEADLLALASPLTKKELEDVEKAEEMDDLGEGDAGDGMKIDISAPEDIAGAVGAAARAPIEKRLGALRILGVMRSAKGLPILLKATKHRQAPVRMAAAAGLRYHAEEQGLAELTQLVKDNEPKVGFEAAYSLWKREVKTDALLPLAAQMIPVAETRARAAEVLCALGSKEHLPLLEELAQDPGPDTRRTALKALLRLEAVEPQRYPELLLDPDDQVIAAALAVFPENVDDQLLTAAQRLANDPLGSLAQAARLALSAHRPVAEREKRLFDLEIEHSYLRMKLVDQLASARDPSALDDLEKACANPDAHTRTHALKRLLAVAPERAQGHVLRSISDPYRWVRLHAASFLSGIATADSSKAIREALAGEKDEATRLYLEDALAKAEGKPAPPPRPAARSVRGKRNLTWLCGAGLDSEKSPFDAYYCLSVKVGEQWKTAHQAGKIFFGRVNTVGNPGQVVVDPDWQDRFWLAIQGEVTDENLPYLDGLVFGEESMSSKPETLWPQGWRLFCLDAGLDPARVGGDQTKLTVPEARAWRHWALQRVVDGFNVLYDYVHLRYGKLKPGLQVSTFLPEEALLSAGANPGDLRWNFDVGGLYDYKGCNRMAAYNMVRRYKTLWPDRPIIWLSLGIGGYEMNPVKRTLRVPTAPLTSRGDRAWADSITAYLAGADTGYFSVWIFVDKNFKGGMHNLSGVQTLVEDITPESGTLRRGIAYSFRGVEEEYSLKMEGKPKLEVEMVDKGGEFEEADDEEEIESALTGEMTQKEKIAIQVKADKERFFRGFHFYRKYVYDCARIFKSLPRQHAKPPALAIRDGVCVWSRPRTGNPLVPGMAILNSYDFLCDINKTPDLDLARYRLIVVHNPATLTDRTIAALTKWLKEQPGLLYVHINLTDDNSAEASTPEDHDGVLKNDWPWEKDVEAKLLPAEKGLKEHPLRSPHGQMPTVTAQLASTFALNGPNAQTLLSTDGKPCLVLWRKPGDFKGGVVFDGLASASADYLRVLKEVLAEVHRDFGHGLELRGPILHQSLEADGLTAAAATGYYRTVSESYAYEGVDLLTGEPNPKVGGGRSGTIVARDLRAEYVACVSGIAILCEQPIKEIREVDGALIVRSDGLIRAASETGAVKVTRTDGELPTPESPMDWLVFGKEEGVLTLPLGKTGNQVVYVRSRAPVRVTKTAPAQEKD